MDCGSSVDALVSNWQRKIKVQNDQKRASAKGIVNVATV